jgi:hypothetical protein
MLKGEMKPTESIRSGIFVLAGTLVLCVCAGAQQTAQPDARRLQSYDAGREVTLVGTVVKYEASSSAPPMGAHLLVQTASGQVDVHLGNPRVLQASHLELNVGDSVRIVGESLALGNGTFFAARIVQKGAQAVAVRNAKGLLLRPSSVLSQTQKDDLRGVR